MELITVFTRFYRDGVYGLQEDVSFYLRVKVQLQDDELIIYKTTFRFYRDGAYFLQEDFSFHLVVRT